MAESRQFFEIYCKIGKSRSTTLGILFLGMLTGGCQTQTDHSSAANSKLNSEIQETDSRTKSTATSVSPDAKDSNKSKNTESVTQSFPEQSSVGVPESVALILAPGGARAFAYPAVIREMERAKIPIRLVIGLEWGALAGAFYASNGKVHETEWRMFKFKSEDIPKKRFIIDKFQDHSASTLKKYFSETLGNLAMEQFEIPFACPTWSVGTGQRGWLDKGSAVSALEKCISAPPIFSPTQGWVAEGIITQDMIKYARGKGATLIVLVHALSTPITWSGMDPKADSVAMMYWNELRSFYLGFASPGVEVVSIAVPASSLDGFAEAKEEFAKAGDAAGKKAVDRWIQKYGF